MLEATVLGPLFAAHGYLFLLLFRQGVGLSVGQGIAGGDLMARARAAGGQATRNRVQWQLLEGAEGEQARAALRLLRSRSDVDPRRIGIVGHSFGGSLSLLLAARDSNVRAVVVFGAAAGSWTSAPALRAALRAAVRTTAAPVLFVHAANDYSTVPGQELAAEMQRAGKHHRLTILAPFGQTADDGHNVVFRNIPMWESAVLDFLRQHL
jgi:dienelactone hydrolase